MTKFQLNRADAPWDYPALGFRADTSNAILDGSLFTPAITAPPDAFWTVYGGGSAQTGITLIPDTDGNPPVAAYPTDGSLPVQRRTLGSVEWMEPADWVADTEIGAALTAAIDTQVVDVDAGDSFLDLTRRYRFTDTAAAKNSLIDLEHYGDGTGNLASPGQTYGLDIHNNAGARCGLVIHDYSDIDPSIIVDSTDDKAALRLHKTQNLTRNPTGIGDGPFISFMDHDVETCKWSKDHVLTMGAKTFTILQNNTAQKALSLQTATNTPLLELLKANTGNANVAEVTNPGTGKGVLISQTGQGTALQISANNAGAAGVYPLVVFGQDYGPHFATGTDNGQALKVAKNGTGAGTALQVVNAGNGATLELRSASALMFQISPYGVINYIQGVNVNVMAGAGTPEGVQSAPIGSVYHRTDGGAGTSFYVKESGTGNTGWVAK